MLYTGIPSYRLPRDLLAKEIKTIQSLGVEIKTNFPIGPHLTLDDLFRQGYRAVFLGMGAQEVSILYRRSLSEMPANEEEIKEAEEEGIQFQFLTAPTEIMIKDGKVTSLRCLRMELGEPDASGRRRPVPIQGSDFFVETETIIPAIGQTPDLSFLQGMMIETTPQGTINIDPTTLQTSREGVFAGGDAVSGPWIAIEAVAAGKEAALSIERYLRGKDLYEGREKPKLQKARFEEIYADQPKSPRERREMIPAAERRKNFSEVKKGFSEEQAKKEALRCLNCGLCSECLQCAALCKAGAINHQMKEEIGNFRVGSIILTPGFDEYNANRLIS